MGQTIKILLKEPEEIKNPQNYPSINVKHPLETKIAWAALTSALRKEWKNGQQAERQAWQAQMVDVDLDEMVKQYRNYEIECLSDSHMLCEENEPMTFTEYLKEQLGVK